MEWLSRGRREGDLFRLINYQFKSAEVKAKRVVLTIPNIPPSPRIKEKCKHLLNYRRYSQYFKSAQSSLKLKLRTLNTYPTFCFQYPRRTENKGFNATKESVYIRKEFISHRTGLRSLFRFVLGHQHGGPDVMSKGSIWLPFQLMLVE